ncbi:hypothetical protein K431DRAFT_285844 [Polychaeton citri CBS 116435]|uniref:TFIIE beta domain-containing protein n=1 Tax=Polychaeton citri CBS 116435 TaxID=1314669 RepID=A0A9P4Q5V3_9PEZI|nr:hypothetical protein K431DRAFT_285844 [Polychaeton citri CBS 116435]
MSLASTYKGAHSGTQLMTQVVYAIEYLKEKRTPVTVQHLIDYLNIPHDSKSHIPRIETALRGHERVQMLSKSESGLGKEAFKYRPLHPVTNTDELKTYLAIWNSAQGISVKELKDGWPDCTATIDEMEKAGELLVTRYKKDNTPAKIWPDRPEWHAKVDDDFLTSWTRFKLPINESDVRGELEKSGITPTSQVKFIERKLGNTRKEKRKINRRGGKTTNSHMAGILKDYGARRA